MRAFERADVPVRVTGMSKLIAAFALLAACAASWAQDRLSFQDRVRAQEALERVYYAHRIWPKQNPEPKPPLEAVVPQAAIEAKVTQYLQECSALEEFWQRPIMPEQLQAEIDRMVRDSRDPDMLHELFSALQNDPSLIAECLARPCLASRIARHWYSGDDRLQGAVRARARSVYDALLRGRTPPPFPDAAPTRVTYLAEDSTAAAEGQSGSPGEVVISADQFSAMMIDLGAGARASGAPQGPRLEESEEGVTVSRLLSVSPGRIEVERWSFRKVPLESWLATRWPTARLTGRPATGPTRYRISENGNPTERQGTCSGQWVASGLDEVVGRTQNVAVWTGTEMFIWGGDNNLNTGGLYNPSTDTWRITPTGEGCPEGRANATAVWTGTEVILWGGNQSWAYVNSGARYNPAAGTWSAVSQGEGCPSARNHHSAIWTGTEMVVWGGGTSDSYQNLGLLNSGGRYRPDADVWTPTSMDGDCPSPRDSHAAIWTGNVMIVWGGRATTGYSGFLVAKDGAVYDPAQDRWISTSVGANCPAAAFGVASVWTGAEMLIWGPSSSGRYDPVHDSWSPLPQPPFLETGEGKACSVWTGKELIVWGGSSRNHRYSNAGARFNPDTGAWTATSMGTNCPTPRETTTAVWTGSEMIIWGGEGLDGNDMGIVGLSTGGRYNPESDAWLPTATPRSGPSKRINHTAVWTGSELIVWGGTGFIGYFSEELNSGGRYSPSTDAWTTVPTGSGCPAKRYYHSAVWTGQEIIIWGGFGNTRYQGTGGRYNPASDTWRPTASGGAPSGRQRHTAVWTGRTMVIWGGDDGWSPLYLRSGGRYTPSSDSWLSTSTASACPSGRILHSAVWTGTEMIVWGGLRQPGGWDNTGGRYDPQTNQWSSMSSGAACPSLRAEHGAVWTGTEMIVWGGRAVSYFNDGAKYSPSADSWTPISSAGCPTARAMHTMVWTGKEMLVWGGQRGEYPMVAFDGGRYEPDSDTWSSMAIGPYQPVPRSYAASVWTGRELMVWGGYTLSVYLGSGGIYLPPGISCPRSPAPADGQSGVPQDQKLSWEVVDSASSYDVYFGVSSPPPFATTVSTPSFDPGLLSVGQVYRWKVVPRGPCGTSGGCEEWSFSTQGAIQISQVTALKNPLRLKVVGQGFAQGAVVRIDGTSAPGTQFKDANTLIATGGAALKNRLPKGVPVQVSVASPDGSESPPVSFTR
jgi:hypothetical protein